MQFSRFTSIKLFKDYSILAILIIVISTTWTISNTKLWKQKKSVIDWDVVSYYAYLPATFIYHDLKLDLSKDIYKQHPNIFWPSKAPNGGNVIKTSMGLSVLYLPFFMIGHLSAHISGADTGGFSAPYKFWLIIGSLFYLIFALTILRKILLKNFSQIITGLTLLIIVVSTNLFYYSTFEAAMSHVYSFFLFIVFIWLTIRWHNNPTLLNTFFIGCAIGIISLVRTSNVLIGLFFVFYNIFNFNDLKSKISFFLKKWYFLVLIISCIFIAYIPQFLYWKYVTGQYFYWSYGSNEGFFFNDPKIFKALFNFRKGWFIYTPIMFIATLGLIFVYKNLKQYFWAIVVFMTLNIYVISSWYCWWYGGGFGHRGMIDSYGVMAIPLAAFIHWVSSIRNIPKITISVLIAAISILGVFHTVQYNYGAIHYDSNTAASYWNSFGRVRPSGKFLSLLEKPDYEAAEKGERDKIVVEEKK